MGPDPGGERVGGGYHRWYAGEFTRTGFRGGLNWYRNIDRNWELMAAWTGAKVTVPALYVAGDRDLVLAFRGMDQFLPALKQFVTDLRQTIILPGCGHWTPAGAARRSQRRDARVPENAGRRVAEALRGTV